MFSRTVVSLNGRIACVILVAVFDAWRTWTNRLPPWLRPAPQSGPAVARTFHRLLALIFLDAWISLARQLDVLIGSRGLISIAAVVESIHRDSEPPIPFWRFPTLLRLGA